MWSLKGKTCLVTGANSGIGYATALALAQQGAHVVLLCRNEQKGRDAVSGIAKHSPDTPELLVCDLADPLSIRGAVFRFLADHQALHVLVNNAGLLLTRRSETDAGHEMTVQINHLGPFLLTHLLREILVTSAPARVINLSSFNHRFGVIDFDDLHYRKRAWTSFKSYNDTKLMNVLFTRELARQLAGSGVTANAVHPGTVATSFGADEPGWLKVLFPLIHRLIRTPAQGADTVVYLASAPEVADRTGGYWYTRRERQPAARALDDAVARRLWSVSRELTGVSMDTMF